MKVANIIYLMFLATMAWSFHANACQISEWIEGIRIYRDGVETGTSSPVPPATCTSVGVTPCGSCVYTARFYRGTEESPDSEPLIVEINSSPTNVIIDLSASGDPVDPPATDPPATDLTPIVNNPDPILFDGTSGSVFEIPHDTIYNLESLVFKMQSRLYL